MVSIIRATFFNSHPFCWLAKDPQIQQWGVGPHVAAPYHLIALLYDAATKPFLQLTQAPRKLLSGPASTYTLLRSYILCQPSAIWTTQVPDSRFRIPWSLRKISLGGVSDYGAASPAVGKGGERKGVGIGGQHVVFLMDLSWGFGIRKRSLECGRNSALIY